MMVALLFTLTTQEPAPNCICRCDTPTNLTVMQWQPAAPTEAVPSRAWAFGALFGLALVATSVFLLSRLDRIVGAFRRSELSKRWWAPPLKWLLRTLFECAVVVSFLLLTKAMGW